MGQQQQALVPVRPSNSLTDPVSDASYQMDTRPSPVWLHTDAAMLETGTEG